MEVIDHARAEIEGWHRDTNEHRPHRSLGALTPTESIAYHQARTVAEPTPLSF